MTETRCLAERLAYASRRERTGCAIRTLFTFHRCRSGTTQECAAIAFIICQAGKVGSQVGRAPGSSAGSQVNKATSLQSGSYEQDCRPVVLSDQFECSACIGMIRRIGKILLLKPGFFLIILWNVDPFDLENDGAGSIIAASDHHAVIVCPFLHDRTALKRSINIPANRVPGFTAKSSVHQMIEIILLGVRLSRNVSPTLKKGQGPDFGSARYCSW